MATRVEATAIGRLIGMAILGGLSAGEAMATARPLTSMAVKVEKRRKRDKRRELVQLAAAVAQIEDEGLHHLYTPAQLHALYHARSWDEVPALIAEWEAWEREAEASPYDLFDLSNDYCAA